MLVLRNEKTSVAAEQSFPKSANVVNEDNLGNCKYKYCIIRFLIQL